MKNTNTQVREVIALLSIVAGVGWIAAHYGVLPDRIPIHFGLLGRPDGWAPKDAIWLMPVMSVFMYVVLSVGQLYPKDPNVPWKITEQNRQKTREMARGLIGNLKAFILWAFAYIQFVQVQVALNQVDGLGVWFAPVFIGGVFGFIIDFFVRGRKACVC